MSDKPTQFFTPRDDPEARGQEKPNAIVIVLEDEATMRTALCQGIDATPGLQAWPVEPTADRLTELKDDALLYGWRTTEGRDVMAILDVSTPRPYGTPDFPSGFAAAAYLARKDIPVAYSTSLAQEIREHEGSSAVHIPQGTEVLQKTGNLMTTVRNAVQAANNTLAAYRASKAPAEEK